MMFRFKIKRINRPGFASALTVTLYAIITICSFGVVESDHTTFCVNLPGLRYRKGLKSIGMEKFPQSKTFWEKFQEDIIAGSAQHPRATSLFHHHTNPGGEFNIYRIKNTKKTDGFLEGWFRIEVKIKQPASDLHTSLKALLLFVTDGWARRQNIGEFSLHFPYKTSTNCPKNDANKYMIISCGGASKNEPLVSNMIVLVRNNPKKDGKIFPDGYENIMPTMVGQHSLNFYVRIPIQDCNQKELLMFRARLIFDKTELPYSETGFTMVSSYLRIEYRNGGRNIPGGSDALPSPSNAKYLDCGQKMTLDSPQDRPWYSQLDNENHNPPFQPDMNGFYSYEPYGDWGHIYACQANYFEGRCPDHYFDMGVKYLPATQGSDRKDFTLLRNQNKAQINQIPICAHKPKSTNVFTSLKGFYAIPGKFNGKVVSYPHTFDYLKTHHYECSKIYNNDPLCEITTVVINVPVSSRSTKVRETRRRANHPRRLRMSYLIAESGADDGDFMNSSRYQNYTGNNRDPDKDKYKGIGFNETGFPKLIWGLRKGHATVMGLIVFLILPINLFITRYFKESFMDKRVLFSRIWYQIHVHCTFMITGLLFAGVAVAIASSLYLGKSLTVAAKVHRALGYVAVALFIILFGSGGFRGFEEPWRKITIIVHWFLGLIFYLLMAGEVVSAEFIPASGISKYDRSLQYKDSEEDNTIRNGALYHVIVWIIVEVVMHVIMMGNMFVSDSRMAVVERRIYCPVPIPVLREHSRLNAKGHGLRVIALAAYVFLASISTALFFIAYIINVDSVEEFGLGPMDCTHHPNNLSIRHEIAKECH